MNVLYLHGLYSSPNAEKMAALHTLGLHVTCPQIDYARPDVFAWLTAMATQTKTQVIIGSSMGGYAGYYLSRLLGVPALLFNPAFEFAATTPPAVDKTGTYEPLQFFAIGTTDDVVLPPQTFNFLLLNKGNYTLWLDHAMAHQIPLQNFVTHCTRFIQTLKAGHDF